MRGGCEAFFSSLKKARVGPGHSFAQNLPPFPKQKMRVEREVREQKPLEGQTRPRHSRIVHSYGQGGSGWSLSFGCAEDVANLVEDALKGLAPRAMSMADSPLQSRL